MNFRENVEAVLSTNIPWVSTEIKDIIIDRICELHENDLDRALFQFNDISEFGSFIGTIIDARTGRRVQ